ncbi:class F sortase [Streptomyces sp. BI20]|uniref:class F sortase n=1 Tax=Streptomyces sp. BI20 TaxID=3403460 RepID=UPI003C76C22F
MSEPRERSAGGRVSHLAVYALLLAALWLWGRELTSGSVGVDSAVAAAPELPAALAPLPASPPVRLDLPVLGVQAPVRGRGLDRDGAPDPPPFDRPGTVGWWDGGPKPGGAGPALLVGHVDTTTEAAVFHGLSTVRRGDPIRVVRADGGIAEFTVEEVRVYSRDGFAPERAYGPRVRGRAELRLLTCGGSYDKGAREYTGNVVVSAYLTGFTRPTAAVRDATLLRAV